MTLLATESLESPASPSVSSCCPIVELRQYTMHPGRRDVLIDLFDREFIESQEALGIRVIGQFRDLDRPDYFVWLRGFPDMESRLQALTTFYSTSPNTFPALPVREGEQVFVWFAMVRAAAEYEESVAAIERSVRWKAEVEGGLARWVRRAPEVLRLAPTGRSRLRV